MTQSVQPLPCPICKLQNQLVRVWDYGERLTLECPRCGKFTITGTAARMASAQQLGPKLSAWIRDRTEAAVTVPEINSNTLKNVEPGLPNYNVSEKQLILLRSIARKTAYPGEAIKIDLHFDYPLAWASGPDEFRYLLRSAIQRGLVTRTDGSPLLADATDYHFEIAPSGWDFLDKNARPSVISDQAFVAMAFAEELTPAWETGIRPALSRARFRPYRTDAEPHIDRIDAKIITEIKNSRFMIADVTMQRPGVYFEAGYAIGLGLPVFWCVRSDDLANVHFDTRQYNHIVWQTEKDLEDQLYLFVTAIVGSGSAT